VPKTWCFWKIFKNQEKKEKIGVVYPTPIDLNTLKEILIFLINCKNNLLFFIYFFFTTFFFVAGAFVFATTFFFGFGSSQYLQLILFPPLVKLFNFINIYYKGNKNILGKDVSNILCKRSCVMQ